MVHSTLPVLADTAEEATRELLEVDEILSGQYRLLHSPGVGRWFGKRAMLSSSTNHCRVALG
jgi:hypothetical protein